MPAYLSQVRLLCMLPAGSLQVALIDKEFEQSFSNYLHMSAEKCEQAANFPSPYDCSPESFGYKRLGVARDGCRASCVCLQKTVESNGPWQAKECGGCMALPTRKSLKVDHYPSCCADMGTHMSLCLLDELLGNQMMVAASRISST